MNKNFSFCIGTMCFVCLTAYVFSLNIVPYFTTEHLYFFREDNFWSYESGISRRAAPGQLIWYLDILSMRGPFLYSGLLFAVFCLSIFILIFRSGLTLHPSEAIVLIFSPIFLLYSVDSEILLILPALALFSHRIRAYPFLLIPIIVLTCLLREIALILYAPILLTLFLYDWRKTAVCLLASIGLCGGVIYTMMGETAFALEKNYWPGRGIEGLDTYGLYNFLDISLPSVLKFHLSVILTQGFPLNVAFWLSAVALFCNICYQRTGSWLFSISFLGIFLACGILSIDHGRYMYFYFILVYLLTAKEVQALTVTGCDTIGRQLGMMRDPLPKGLYALLTSRWIRRGALAALVLLPSAYFAGGLFEKPRALVFMSELNALGSEFWAPEKPGERFIR